jgi:hypothetical protein
MTSSRLTYRFGPLEKRGLLGPLRLGQAAAIGFGAMAAVVALDVSPSFGGAVLGTALLGMFVAVATLPVGSRTAEEWAPVVVAFASRGARRQLIFRSSVATAGMKWRRGQRRPVDPPARPPRSLRDVHLEEVEYRGHAIGVLSECRGHRLTAALACRGLSFALLDADAQERRLSRWGLALAGAAGSPIRRIQWIERTAPARADELARWVHEARDPAMPLRGTPIVESYLELISGTVKAAQDHEILIAVQVDAARVRNRGQANLQHALVAESERVARALEAAEIRVLGALRPGQLARALRSAFDPYAGAEMAALETVDPGRDGVAAAQAWPLGAREAWDHYASDGACHATYWIGGWPRVDVPPMFMDALLGSSDVVRTVSVTFEPIPPARSTRDAEAAVTRDRADRELRRRFGQGETARQRQTQEAAARREEELAAGHAEVRLAGFVTVSGRDQDELRHGCVQVLEHAARARLELHRMYGQQAEAFTFSLPLARGLR